MNLIFASDENGLIGLNGGLPWRQREDLIRFNRLTSEAQSNRRPVLVMGRNTYESLPGNFNQGNRIISVVTSKDLTVFNSRDIVQLDLKCFAENPKILREETWICGGPKIFSFFVKHVETIFWTKICTKVPYSDSDEATHWSIPIEESWKFRRVYQSRIYEADEKNRYPYQFVKLQRTRS